MASLTGSVDRLDPRIRRTQQLLHDALLRLMADKDFDKISIQDIADASTLNRATFYSHFPDKYALLVSVVGARFRELIARRDVRFDACDGALRAMALVVCDYLAEMPPLSNCRSDASHRYVEGAIVEVLRGMLLEGLERHEPTAFAPCVIASTVAWAIYGAAQEWARSSDRVAAEEMAGVIEALVSPMLGAAVRSE